MVVEEDEFDEIAIEDRRLVDASFSLLSSLLSDADFSALSLDFSEPSHPPPTRRSDPLTLESKLPRYSTSLETPNPSSLFHLRLHLRLSNFALLFVSRCSHFISYSTVALLVPPPPIHDLHL